MSFILSTNTTSESINLINNRLTGGTFDNNQMFWNAFYPYVYNSSDEQFLYGGNIVKRDILYPNNTALTSFSPFESNFSTKNMLAGGGNKLKLGYSFYNTVFAGTGHTIDFTLNNIFAGTENSFENSQEYYHTENESYLNENPDNMSILSGSGNTMSGSYFMPKNSIIISGLKNKIFDGINSPTYIEESGFNTILNGESNLIDGVIGFSWIGNGLNNKIKNSTQDLTRFNFILNGSGNTIEKNSVGSYDYNTIIGGHQNNIVDKNNSTIIGSNLTAINNDTTHVNRIFSDKSFNFNNYTYSAYTNQLGNFNHNGKSVCIIKGGAPIPPTPFLLNLPPSTIINLNDGYYDGQIIYLIGIPSGNVGGNTWNVILDSSNVISIKQTTGVPASLPPASSYNFITINNISDNIETTAENYAGLSILTWASSISKWIRADFRGGI